MVKIQPTGDPKPSRHVLDDFELIANTIERFTDDPITIVQIIRERTHFDNAPLMNKLRSEFDSMMRLPNIGLVTRRELCRRSLVNAGLGDAAREFDDRLTRLLDMVMTWEQEAQSTIRYNALDVDERIRTDPKFRPNLAHFLRGFHDGHPPYSDEFDELLGEASDTVAWLRQLVATKRENNSDGTKPKPRRSTRRCSQRDTQFVEWAATGLSAKEIAAKWNALHTTDNVSDRVVQKAIERQSDI